GLAQQQRDGRQVPFQARHAGQAQHRACRRLPSLRPTGPLPALNRVHREDPKTAPSESAIKPPIARSGLPEADMTVVQAIMLAFVQGITELFPISSLGHAVILPPLLGWTVDENGEGFLPFLVVMHLGTALALLIYFWRDWLEFALAVLVRR